MCPPIVDLRVVQRGKLEVTFDTADSSHTWGTSAIAEISQPMIGEAATKISDHFWAIMRLQNIVIGGTARAKALSAAELSKIGKQGGKARAAKLTAAQRSEIARKAVQARIAKHGQQKRKGDKA